MKFFRIRGLVIASLAVVILTVKLSAGSRPEAAKLPADSPIRIGLMADFTGLPFLVAEQAGLFVEADLKVELSLFRSALERDAAFQAGALDGCNADLIAALALRQAGYEVRIAAAAFNRFSLVAGPRLLKKLAAAHPELEILPGMELINALDEVELIKALAGAEIAVSKNTVIEYVADSLLADLGTFSKIDIARIPIRLELLLQGQVDAAVLPLPFDELAVAAGGLILRDSVRAGLDPDLFLFYADELAKRPGAYQALWRAVDQARLMILKEPEAYRALLTSRLGFADDQTASLQFPDFPHYRLPALSQLSQAAAWMSQAGLLTTAINPATLLWDGLSP